MITVSVLGLSSASTFGGRDWLSTLFRCSLSCQRPAGKVDKESQGRGGSCPTLRCLLLSLGAGARQVRQDVGTLPPERFRQERKNKIWVGRGEKARTYLGDDDDDDDNSMATA